MGRNRRIDPAAVEASLGDLDWAIFERLPDEGSRLGYHPMIKSVRKLADELNHGLPPEARLTRQGVGARLRALHIGQLVVPVSTALSGRVGGWQRTARARELLEARRQQGRPVDAGTSAEGVGR